MTISLAVQIQNAINQGMDLDTLRRRFNLSDSELRDYCADIMDDDSDDSGPESVSGY